MSATMVERLFELALRMVEDNPRSSAAKRRAVSTAYYAAFHALLRTCADSILPSEELSSAEYERVYRVIDHGSLKSAFDPKSGPLKDHPRLLEIGASLVQLQSARIAADYLPPRINFYRGSELQDHLDSSRKIIDRLSDLSQTDKRVLAINLLFKVRPR